MNKKKFEEISAIVLPIPYLEDMTEVEREQLHVIPLKRLDEDDEYRKMLLMIMDDYEIIQDYVIDQLEMRLLAYHNERLLAVYNKVTSELIQLLQYRARITEENYKKFKENFSEEVKKV